MRTEEIFALGLGLTPPRKVMSQRLDTEHTPTMLLLEIGADRGALYSCPSEESRARLMTSKNSRGGISTSSSITATSQPDYRGAIALNMESDESKHLGPGKATTYGVNNF